MNIQRMNTYSDPRFSQNVLNQHGCFLVDGAPYEVEIFSDTEAVVRGRDVTFYPAVIEDFRFFTPHITRFFDEQQMLIREYPPVRFLKLPLPDIQPSQFFVDEEKLAAVKTFIASGDDIIIQVMKEGERYIALDGHTRLYFAVQQGWTHVRAVEEISDSSVFDFVEEARKRNIHSPYDLELVSHEDYEAKWIRFCDDFFSK